MPGNTPLQTHLVICEAVASCPAFDFNLSSDRYEKLHAYVSPHEGTR